LYYAYPPPVPGAPPTEVLNGVNFDVHPGEFVALLGRVGAGKTTLCLALDGLAPHATGGVFRGHVTVGGLDTRHSTVPALSQIVGLVFQDPETQLTQMRVEDEVAFGPENLGLPRDEIAARVDWALDAIGLAGYRDRNPAFLSGGEKQRVAIAATLAMRPQVLVLDEPTANLDPGGKAAVFSVLLRLAEERAITILLATQDVERVQRYARRALVLHQGRIALDGPPAEIFERETELRAWGIGVPQIVELAHRLGQRRRRSYHFASVARAVSELRGELHRRPPMPAHADPAERPFTPAGTAMAQLDQGQILIDHLAFTYDDGTPALRDISLSIPAGQFLALAGPNGSGKTTLAKHLNGLLKPWGGRVLVAGQDTRPLRVAQLARTVGYVFQNPDHQIFAATVREEIAFGLRLQGLTQDDVARRVDQALDNSGLSELAELPPATLGSGQRRLVTLMAVLAARPAILVLDEPTGGLDWRTRQDFMERVAAFNRAGGTVILITHDVRIISEYPSRAIVLRLGRILFDGSPAALFAARNVLAAARLTVPPAVRVAQRLAATDAGYGWLARVRDAAELADVL
ncbi:MAG: ABC transporter ATP-binding protein, partial [Nitrososphaerales archaeon]